jgi:hypothetical protein
VNAELLQGSRVAGLVIACMSSGKGADVSQVSTTLCTLSAVGGQTPTCLLAALAAALYSGQHPRNSMVWVTSN